MVSPYTSRTDFNTIIDSAHHTLDLYAEEVNDASIENKLAQAAKRGVRVRLITSESTSAETSLQQRGVQVHIMKSPYVHAKTIVADGKRMYVGSENISATSLDKNREIGILLYKPAQIKVVEDTFAVDWAKTQSGTPPPPMPPSGHAFPGEGDRVSSSRDPRADAIHLGDNACRGLVHSTGDVCRRHRVPRRLSGLDGNRYLVRQGLVVVHTGVKVARSEPRGRPCTSGSASATGTGTFTITA